MSKLRSSAFGWKSVWMELADEHEGEFIDGPHVVTVRIPLIEKPWTLTFKMHEHGLTPTQRQQTHVALPYKAGSDFSFAIHNKTWIEEAAKPFGLQDIVIGDAEFDHEYIIKGSDEARVKELLASDALRHKISAQKSVRLAIHKEPHQLAHYGDVPSGVHVLAFHEDGAINSFERLSSLRGLMDHLIEDFCDIGIAGLKAPAFVV